MKRLDKLLAILVAACLTATMTASTAFALNQTARTLENTTTVTDPASNDPTTDPSAPSDPSVDPGDSSVPSESPSSTPSETPSSTAPSQNPNSSKVSSASEPSIPSINSKPDPASSSSRTEPSVPSTTHQSSSSESVSISSSDTLLPGNSSHSQSRVNSYDWNQLLSNINSDGSTVSMDSKAGGGFLNNNQSNNGGGSWLLIAGIALIIVALGGIGYVIFSQINIRKNNAPLNDTGDLPSGVPVNPTSDTIAFDPVGGDYGDDYDYSTDAGVEDGEPALTDAYDQTPGETADMNSYSHEIEETYEDLDYPQETGYSQGEPLMDVGFEKKTASSLFSKEATIDKNDDATPSSEPEEIFSDTSMKSGGVSADFESIELPIAGAATKSANKKSLDDEDAFDLQFPSSKSNGEDQSPAKNLGEDDDFWDKFFRS
ncbi:MAG: hypothetical protein HFE39_06940 [Clostridiales bacterium]|nr:hypothetical protein [Clostridiales bacterium]